MGAEIGASKAERRGWLARLSLGGGIRAGLILLTLALAAIAALGVADLYRARQHYEDRLAGAYQLEAAGSRLLSATVAEQAALIDQAPRSALRGAAATVDAEAGRVSA